MGRGRKKPLLHNLEMLEAVAEGKSLAKTEDKVVFVTNAVPGDIADVQIVKKRKAYMEGYATQFHKYSDKRSEPVCAHFGTCGGCKWQNLKYTEQLKAKEKTVIDQLTRIGGFEMPDVNPILESKEIYHYRNKLEFTFSNKRWLTPEEINSDQEIDRGNALGFHVPGKFDKIVDIEECHLQASPSNDIRLKVREIAVREGFEFFDLREQSGLMRNIIIRTSSTGEIMVIVIFFQRNMDAIELLMSELFEAFPNISSLMYVINEKKNDTIFDLDVHLFKGKDFIEEKMENLTFKIGPKSFYQTNSKQAYELYQVVRKMADVKGNEIIYDLYTGTGTIAQFMAGNAKFVYGIEYVEAAVEDAKENAKANNLENTFFEAGDMKDILSTSAVEKFGKPDIIITDPPRAGMHEDVVNTLLQLQAPKIVYVSCNPATQARDLQLLTSDYKVKEIQPVDMFPHTHHVENVVLLERL